MLSSIVRYVVAGSLNRVFMINPAGKSILNVPGGNMLYAAVGLAVWDKDIGLFSRAGSNYPVEWLDRLERKGFDCRGITMLTDPLDQRQFIAYPPEGRTFSNPVEQFARAGQPFPRELLDFIPNISELDSRTTPNDYTLRVNNLPSDYLDASAAHLCPVDFLSHNLLPSALRQGHIQTITVDPAPGYMTPAFWDHLPPLVHGINAFLCSEEKMRSLFRSRSSDLWEMAETVASWGCEMVVIKRGELGQYLYDGINHSRWVLPAYPVRLVNPTGAGDAFCGGFLAGYRATYDPLQATLHGNISASLILEGDDVFYALDTMPGLAAARRQALADLIRRG
ncbi:MAG TPA: carbohydrate kinase family protein [Anaerolineaceae bacterium]|nr:carbohydrate kinase family protein [Anaerolineaceae bacterium]HPN53122.1 carbohydrate kinase family protein [Anaerolineaceae bacterium]